MALVITNLAVYKFPPPVDIDGAQFMVFNPTFQRVPCWLILWVDDWQIFNINERYPLQDILLTSLPYRSGVSAIGQDFAIRMDDFILHMRDETDHWFQAKEDQRSLVVEVLSDAYHALLGIHIECHNPEFSTLISSLLDKSVHTTIRDMRMVTHNIPAFSTCVIHHDIT
jgi:hypothetical protein